MHEKQPCHTSTNNRIIIYYRFHIIKILHATLANTAIMPWWKSCILQQTLVRETFMRKDTDLNAHVKAVLIRDFTYACIVVYIYPTQIWHSGHLADCLIKIPFWIIYLQYSTFYILTKSPDAAFLLLKVMGEGQSLCHVEQADYTNQRCNQEYLLFIFYMHYIITSGSFRNRLNFTGCFRLPKSWMYPNSPLRVWVSVI